MQRMRLGLGIALVGLLAGCQDPIERKEKEARAASLQAERAWRDAEETARESAADTDKATRVARQKSDEAEAKLAVANLELRRAVEKDLDGIDDRAAQLALDVADEKNGDVRAEAERRIRALRAQSRSARERMQQFQPADADHLSAFKQSILEELRAMRDEIDEIKTRF
jgi:hypothetical protein